MLTCHQPGAGVGRVFQLRRGEFFYQSATVKPSPDAASPTVSPAQYRATGLGGQLPSQPIFQRWHRSGTRGCQTSLEIHYESLVVLA